MKVEFQTMFKETGVKSETYFANTMTINSLYNGKMYKIVMRIKTDYMDCVVDLKLSENTFKTLIESIKGSLNEIELAVDKHPELRLMVHNRKFNNKNIAFVRYDVCKQPVCCFKMTEPQVDQLINAWSDEHD